VTAASWEIREGECIEQMRQLEECSVDAVVTDPPYGIGFMGHEWDQPGEFGPVGANGEPAPMRGGRRRKSQPRPGIGAGHARERKPLNGHGKREGVRREGMDIRGVGDHQQTTLSGGAMHAGRYDLSLAANQRFQAWCEAWAREAYRVLKPGGHMLVFGGTRTFHRMASGMEDAGFEVRDCLTWLYGSGFPKSRNVAKALVAEADREARAWFELSHGTRAAERRRNRALKNGKLLARAAELHAGEGTALKPSWEPIIMARKPLDDTVAANVLEHGTGAINVDGCRLGARERTRYGLAGAERSRGNTYGKPSVDADFDASLGRWPPNVALGHIEDCVEVGSERWACVAGCPVRMLDEESGVLAAPGNRGATPGEGLGYHGSSATGRMLPPSRDDAGGASRFMYCAKASSAERNAGLSEFEVGRPDRNTGHTDGRQWDIPGSHSRSRANTHPTVKPIDLMRWLVRMVTPPGGVVLDPFTGSGTTGCAAVLEGFAFLGIEREAKYIEIAEARIAFWYEHPTGLSIQKALEADRERQRVAKRGQLSLEAA
jgi:site-specific DNA-methyltransferase (adenine-specific)